MSAVLKCMRDVSEKTAALKKATTKAEKELAGAALALAEAALARAMSPLTPTSKTSKYKKTVEEEEETDDDDDDDDPDGDDDDGEDEKTAAAESEEDEEDEEDDKKAAKSKAKGKAAKSSKSPKSSKSSPSRIEALVMSLTGTTDLKEAAGRLAAMGETNANLARDVKQLKAGRQRDKLEQMIAAGRADMRITPGNESKVRAMAKDHGLKAAAAMVDALVPAIGAETFEPIEEASTEVKVSAQQKKIWAKQGLNEEQMTKAAKLLADRNKMNARIVARGEVN